MSNQRRAGAGKETGREGGGRGRERERDRERERERERERDGDGERERGSEIRDCGKRISSEGRA